MSVLLPTLLLACELFATDTGDSSTSTDTMVGALVQGGVVTCADPSLRETLGPMEQADLGDEWAAQVPEGWDQHPVRGQGAVVADLTGDGLLDVFLANSTPNELFIQQADGTLKDEALTRLPHWGEMTSSGASTADVDGDGDLDLFLGNLRKDNRLYLNDGTGQFADAGSEGGFRNTKGASMGGSWGDLDSDGDLDLFIMNNTHADGPSPPHPGHANQFLRNNGDGTFEDLPNLLEEGAPRDGYNFITGWVDIDADGDFELYVVNDHGVDIFPNALLDIRGTAEDPELVDIAPELGLDVGFDGMGLGIGDLNGDGLPDFLMSDWGPLRLLMSEGEGTVWVESALALGLVPEVEMDRVVSWSTELVDMDNDGLLDAVVAFGQSLKVDPIEANPENEPNGLWLQQTDGTFVQVAEEWQVGDTGITRGLLPVDWNGDGSLDLLSRSHDQPAILYLSRCGEAAWLRVKLEGKAPNTSAVGARVEVIVDGVTQTRWMSIGSTGLASSGPPEVHFGLGPAPHVDVLRVTWPGGKSEEWVDVETRQVLTVIQDG